MKKIVLGLTLLAMSTFAFSQDVALNDNVPDEYVVRKGDTLWDISGVFLRDPWMWPEIWHINQQIANPHLIYPGDIISLVYVDGKPRLTVKRSRNVKLSPEVRVLPRSEAIAALPLGIINNFLSKNRVATDAELKAAPYVLGGTDRRILLGNGDDFYARGDFSSNPLNYGIYRRGKAYIDPKTEEVLGIRAEDVGAGKVKAVDDDIATLGATRSEFEIRAEDRLLPHEERVLDSTFYPKAPEGEIEGSILQVEGGVNSGGALDVVSISRGAREGLQAGDTLAIYKRGEVIKDRVANERVRLPDERIGLLMVFYVYEKMSYGLIMESDRPTDNGDVVRNP